MDKKNKNEKGITGIDISISIFAIIIFSSLIATIFFNIAIINTSKKRNAMATIYTTEILEDVANMEYENINDKFLKEYLQTKYLNSNNVNIQDYNSNYEVKGYTITINVTNYNEIYGENNGINYDNRNKEDLIKIVKVKVEYKVGKNIDFVEISRINTKEN